MSTNHFLTINEFAQIARTTKDALRHYDQIGLLAPKARGTNNYRYYAIEQLAHFNVIRTLRELGMTLTEIKDLKKRRTPQLAKELFEVKMAEIDQVITKWERAKKLLLTINGEIQSVLGVDEREISVRYLEAEPIVLGEKNNYEGGDGAYEALNVFYRKMEKKYPDLDLNYPVWAMFEKEKVAIGDREFPDRYYFYNPDGKDRRPAGWYAVGYMRGGYGGDVVDLHQRMMKMMETEGWEIGGEAYEEFPLNEVSVTDGNNYLIRVMVRVRKKEGVEEKVEL